MGDSDRDMNGIVKLPASAACQGNEAMTVAPFEQHGFRFNLTGSGLLSYAEFERMVLAQEMGSGIVSVSVLHLPGRLHEP